MEQILNETVYQNNNVLMDFEQIFITNQVSTLYHNPQT